MSSILMVVAPLILILDLYLTVRFRADYAKSNAPMWVKWLPGYMIYLVARKYSK